MSASSSMTRSSRRRRRARRGKVFLRTTSQSRLRLDSSPGRGAFGRPGQPYCSLGPDGAQSSGPCSHWQRYCIAAVNLNSGARPFPIAKNFARSARPLPTRQWLPYQGSWHREAMTERLCYMPRFRFASRFPGGALPCVGTERFFQPQRRFILRHHLFFGPLLGLVEEAGGLFAGAEQLKVQRFIIRRGKHPLPCLVGDSLPRAEAKNQRRNQIL